MQVEDVAGSPEDELGDLPKLKVATHSRTKRISEGSIDKYGTGADDADKNLISVKSDTHIHVERRRPSRSGSVKMGSHGKLNGMHGSVVRYEYQTWKRSQYKQ